MKNTESILFSKSSLVFDCIPEEYSNLILNSILARAIENGTLSEELRLYFVESEIEEIEDEIGFKIPEKNKVKPKRVTRRTIEKEGNLFSKEKKEEVKKESSFDFN